jgi:hypothetical protein
MNTEPHPSKTADRQQRLVIGRTVWWTHHWKAGDDSGTHRLPFLLQKVMGDKAQVINDVGFVSIVKTCDLTQGESANGKLTRCGEESE